MRANGRSLIAVWKGRSYSVASSQSEAAVKSKHAPLSKQEAKIAVLPSGLTFAALENNSPISRIAYIYKAGSRVENNENAGLAHCLRIATGLKTKRCTGFGFTRNIQQTGANVLCTTTREHIIYSMECLRSNLSVGAEFLDYAATMPEFRSWELEDASPRIKVELSLLQHEPHIQLMEALHKAAFRKGLGNSLLMPQHMFGKHTPEMLKDYVVKYFVESNLAIVGVGVSLEQLQSMLKLNKFHPQPGKAPEAAKSKYSGGEMRIETRNPLVHVAVVNEGVALTSNDLLTVGILQHVIGSGLYVKYSSNAATSKIGKAATQATNAPCAVNCLNLNYVDGGLFGVHIIGQAADIGKLTKAVLQSCSAIGNGGLTDADVARAKNQAIASLHMSHEDPQSVLEDMSVEAVGAGRLFPLIEVEAALKKVTTQDVQAIARKIINKGKLSMAAVGDLSNTPYLDEILK